MYTEKTGLACIYMRKQPHTVAQGSCHHPVDSTCSIPMIKWFRNRAYLKSVCLLCLLYSVMLNVCDWQAASHKRAMMMMLMMTIIRYC